MLLRAEALDQLIAVIAIWGRNGITVWSHY